MQRRKTTIGKGPFGRPVPFDQHAADVLDRILLKGAPLTEDAVFLSMYLHLRQHKGSRMFQKVRASKNLGGYRYFGFSPDVDLLEVRNGGAVVGYELKGFRKAGREVQAPSFYEGVDQALALLKNPVSSPLSDSFAGSVFDYVYLVHPEGSHVDALADLLHRCTPIGLIVVSYIGPTEVVKPKLNPFLEQGTKSFFVSRLDALESYTKFRVNPVQ